MSDRILVTGGAGFIGSHVCERLVDEWDGVWILDSFDRQYAPAVKRRNVAGLASRPSVHLVEGDVRDPVLLGGLFSDIPFDAVVHMAARHGLPDAAEDPDACYEVNVRGTLRLLEAMARQDVTRLVLASSTTGSGQGADAPTGDDDVDLPASPHAASERSAELAAHAYHRTHGLSVHCLRLPTVYGPRQRPDQDLHRLARRLDSGEPFPAPGAPGDDGGGRARRDYLYVSDAADAVCLSLDRLLTADAPAWSTVDVGGAERLTAEEMASALGAAMGLEPAEGTSGDQDRGPAPTRESTTKAREVLGFCPEVGTEEGLRRFVDWFRGEGTTGNGASPGRTASVTGSEPHLVEGS